MNNYFLNNLIPWRKIVALAALIGVVFVFADFFIMNSGIDRQMNGMGIMVDCPFMAHAEATCPISATEHKALWDQVFSVNIEKAVFTAIAVVLVLYLAITELHASWRIVEQQQNRQYKLYLRGSPDSGLFSPLRLLFAKGILNPKLHDSYVS